MKTLLKVTSKLKVHGQRPELEENNVSHTDFVIISMRVKRKPLKMVTRSTRIIFFLQRSFWGNQMCENPREFPWFECERTEPKVRGTCPHCSWQNLPVPLSDIYELIFFFFIFRQVVYGENSIEVEVKSYWRLFIEEVILLEWKCYNFFWQITFMSGYVLTD